MYTKKKKKKRGKKNRRENLSWVFFLTFPISPTPSNDRMRTLVFFVSSQMSCGIEFEMIIIEF
jgi:hypothetical protein